MRLPKVCFLNSSLPLCILPVVIVYECVSLRSIKVGRPRSACFVCYGKDAEFYFYMLEWFRKNLYNDLCYSIMQQGIELVAGCDFSNFVSFWKVSLNKRSHRKQKKSRRVKVNNPWKNHSQLKSSKGDLIILKSKLKFNLLQFSVSPRLVTFGLYKNFFIEI